MELPPILIIIGSYFAMAGGVWALFDRADKALTEPFKKSISNWLQGKEMEAKWPGQFIDLFDSVFGKKHLSWSFYFRSCVASFIAINILLLIYLGIRGPETIFIVRDQFIWKNIFIIYMIGALINFLPDYVSLLETRYILKWMNRSQFFLKTLGFLCLDLVVSSMLITLGFVFVFFSFYPFFNPTSYFDFVIQLFTPILFFSKGAVIGEGELNSYQIISHSGLFGVFFYSTFFTSVWIWLYGLSGLAIKTCNKVGRAFHWFSRFLDFENKPLPALGFVSNLIILFIYLVGFGFFYEGTYL